MARSYGTVRPSFWTGSTGKRLRSQPAETALVGVYLCTNGHASAIGIYHLPRLYIQHETGRPGETIDAALAWLERDCFAFYDEEREEVFVPNMAREQIGPSLALGDKRRLHVIAELDRIRGSKFVGSFLELYGAAYGLPDNRSPFEGASKGLTSPSEAIAGAGALQEQEQEQEQEQRKDSDESFRNTPSEKWKPKTPQQQFVDDAWAIYDRFDGKRAAPGLLNAWAKEIFAGHRDWMLRELEELAKSGYLAKGDAYMRQALAGVAARNNASQVTAPAAALAVGTLSRDGTMQYNGEDWDPVVKPRLSA